MSCNLETLLSWFTDVSKGNYGKLNINHIFLSFFFFIPILYHDHTAVFRKKRCKLAWLIVSAGIVTLSWTFKVRSISDDVIIVLPLPLQPLCLFTCRSVVSGLKGHRLAPLTSWPPAASTPDQQILNQSFKVCLLPTDCLTVAREQLCTATGQQHAKAC